MTKLVIRDLDEKTVAELRLRAANHGRSLREEANEILRSVLTTTSTPPKGNLAELIRRRFAPLGGVEIEVPRRDAIRKVRSGSGSV
jgi:plasmid stability protein